MLKNKILALAKELESSAGFHEEKKKSFGGTDTMYVHGAIDILVRRIRASALDLYKAVAESEE